MDKQTKQILDNQVHIMAVLRSIAEDKKLEGYVGSLTRKINITKDLLNSQSKPKESKC